MSYDLTTKNENFICPRHLDLITFASLIMTPLYRTRSGGTQRHKYSFTNQHRPARRLRMEADLCLLCGQKSKSDRAVLPSARHKTHFNLQNLLSHSRYIYSLDIRPLLFHVLTIAIAGHQLSIFSSLSPTMGHRERRRRDYPPHLDRLGNLLLLAKFRDSGLRVQVLISINAISTHQARARKNQYLSIAHCIA